MSHNLNYNQNAGRHSFVSVKSIAWHRLGKVVTNALTSEECIKEALLDYEVDKGFAYVKYNEPVNNSKGSIIQNTFATYRTDNGAVFGVVGKNYEVIQNREAFDFFDSIVGEKRAIYETAGALGLGETVFITAKLPDHITINNMDIIDQYLLLTMSHDGTGSILAKFTPVRVVCNNTLSSALSSGKNLFRIRHTSNVRNKLQNAKNLLQLTYKTSKETEEILKKLTKINITDSKKEEYVSNLILSKEEIQNLAKSSYKWSNSPDISTVKKNIILDILDYSEKGPGQDFNICKGTMYGVYNAVAGYVQNMKNYKDEEKKFSSILLGSDGNLIDKAYNLAIETIN